MRSSRPTLKDIAERSGFALRTVKKVMSGDTSVREKNRIAILEAAAELNYTPNRAASALGKQKQIRLAVVYSRFTDLYFPDVERGFQQCISELFDYGLDLEFHVTKAKEIELQQQILGSLIERDDIDGIVLQPLNQMQLNEMINALVAAGKPVATFGTDAPESNRLFYVSCNGYRAGRIAGQLMVLQRKPNGTVLILDAADGQTQMKERKRGFLEKIREMDPTLSVHCPTLPKPSDYYQFVMEAVSEQDIAGIYVTDAHVIYAGQALKDLKRTDIPLIGYDPSEQATSLMRSGHISFILDQRPEVFSYLSAKLLFEYLSEGNKPSPIRYTPLYILTSECLDEF